MSGYPPYGGNPPYQPQQNQIYPQIYNQPNAPPPPGQPAAMGYPAPGQPYQQPGQPYQQPGFGFNYQGQPPSAMSYPAPGAVPGYGYPGFPSVTPNVAPAVEWIPTTPRDANALADRAVVAGYEGYDHSPLWVIRARFETDLIPGKLAIKHHSAYVPWGGKENAVHNIEVCCARPERVRWVESRDGICPPNAVVAGNTGSGEPLYVGRAKEQGSLTPGKVQQSHNTLYISFAGQEIPHKVYEVLCTV